MFPGKNLLIKIGKLINRIEFIAKQMDTILFFTEYIGSDTIE